MHASTLGGSLQGPSKVIHVRHLPIDATREEIAELCEQWGTVARIRTGAGLKRDQAFVEFAELQSAINMMAFYSTSTGAASEIPRVRAKQVFLQYSNRTEVSESTGGGPDTPSNVLLVHIDDVPPDLPLTLSQLLTVFQAFGNVLKVTCYEKGCNYTVFIQYENEDIAAGARDALNGRAIPKFLLGDRADPIILRVSFSGHQDLHVKAQTHRSRDFTNPYLPVTATANDESIPLSHPMHIHPYEGSVLLVTFENVQYPLTVDALGQVFGAYGPVLKIAIFEKFGIWQALVQMGDKYVAAAARGALEGHAIYEGGYNRMKDLNFSIHQDIQIYAGSDYQKFYDCTKAMEVRGPALHIPDVGAVDQSLSVSAREYIEAHTALVKIARGLMAPPQPPQPPVRSAPGAPPAGGPPPRGGPGGRGGPPSTSAPPGGRGGPGPNRYCPY